MSSQFRELLKKVGSGQHTSKNLSREEAAIAMRMLLQQEATPAQIGAFLIAHRIKRPTGVELAGMLDMYQQLGPKLAPLANPHQTVTVFGVPYDGRTRTAPVTPITALILATAGIPTIMHGSGVFPTKYGLPLQEIFQGWGWDFTSISLSQAHSLLEKTNFTFVYTPKHFPEAQSLVQYREEIGKRPPLATLELIWSPYLGKTRLIVGYVHPPTEKMILEALQLREQQDYLLVKGLEGSCDLRLSQTTIIATSSLGDRHYLKPSPKDYGLDSSEVSLASKTEFLQQIQAVLQGEDLPLTKSVLWNGGFYLWNSGVTQSIAAGIAEVKDLLSSGAVAAKQIEISSCLASINLEVNTN